MVIGGAPYLHGMELNFVYNVRSDIGSAIIDYAHKVVSPSTYACDLCALTHHNLGERKAWKRFRAETPYHLEFMYIDQFEERFGRKAAYPVVFSHHEGELSIVISRDEFSKLKDVDSLIERLRAIEQPPS